MLVVIAIMCILLALLGPAYAQVRSSAALTKCLNNKSQLIKAMTAYADENDHAAIYKGPDYTYADVMAGLSVGTKQLTRAYMPEKALLCSLAKEPALDDNAEKATGMLNALNVTNRTTGLSDVPANCWLESASDYDNSYKNYEVHGRFAKIVDTNSRGQSISSANNRSIVYLFDRMTHPEDLVLFADTFKIVSTGVTDGESYWSFIPNKGDNSAAVTLVHRQRTAVAFADGHADSMDRGKLKDSKTSITVFGNDEFKKDEWSDNL